MAGSKNIKQRDLRSSLAATDFFYIVAGDSDYHSQLSYLKTFLGLDDVEEWQTDEITYNTTSYVDTLVNSTVNAVVKIEYFMKRGSRTYRSGQLTIMYDSSEVVSSDFYD